MSNIPTIKTTMPNTDSFYNLSDNTAKTGVNFNSNNLASNFQNFSSGVASLSNNTNSISQPNKPVGSKLQPTSNMSSNLHNNSFGEINNGDLTVQNVKANNEIKITAGSKKASRSNSPPNEFNFTQQLDPKLMESFKLMYNTYQSNVNIKNDEVYKAKQIEELSERLEFLERERSVIAKQFEIKEATYLETIKSLEQQIDNSEKVDVILLQKQNMEFASQIANLNNLLEKMNIRHNDEKKKFNDIVAEMMQLKEKLKEEIKDLEKINKDVIYENKGKKVELVIRPNDSMVKVEDKVKQFKNKKIDEKKLVDVELINRLFSEHSRKDSARNSFENYNNNLGVVSNNFFNKDKKEGLAKSGSSSRIHRPSALGRKDNNADNLKSSNSQKNLLNLPNKITLRDRYTNFS